MTKIDAENLFASMLHRWMTGDVVNFERDYSEDIVARFDDHEITLEDLKLRTLYFYEHFEIIESKIEDFIYEGHFLAVRLYVKIRGRENHEILEDTFNLFYEIKDKQVINYWAITNHSFGFMRPKNL